MAPGERSADATRSPSATSAFALDPDLACAHHFYTSLEADSGRAEATGVRLASRLNQHEEPEDLAALVQVLRYCGPLEESIAAHERAIAIDPAVQTSVSHTWFVLGKFEAAIEIYGTAGDRCRAEGARRGLYLFDMPRTGSMVSSCRGGMPGSRICYRNLEKRNGGIGMCWPGRGQPSAFPSATVS